MEDVERDELPEASDATRDVLDASDELAMSGPTDLHEQTLPAADAAGSEAELDETPTPEQLSDEGVGDDAAPSAEAEEDAVADHEIDEEQTEHEEEPEDEPMGAEASEIAEIEDEAGDDQDCETEDSAASGEASEAASGEEQSIEEYMAALLNRVRGGTTASGGPTHKAARSKRKTNAVQAPTPPEPVPAVPEVSQRPNVQAPTVLAELERRPGNVETTDLAAMRELANTQARTAIQVHGKRQMVQKSMFNWSASVVCFAVSVGIIWMGPAGDIITLVGALGGLVAGAYWMFLALTNAGNLYVLSKPPAADARSMRKQAAKDKNPPRA